MVITKLRQERVARQWKLAYVAKQIGLTKAAVHDIETGRRKPSYEVLVKLLDLFGYDDPRQLFKLVDQSTNLTDKC